MLALVQIPDVHGMAVLAAQQQLRHQAALDHVGRAPFAGDHHVMAEMPPEIISQLLRSAVDLPAAQHLEGLVVHQEDAARPVARGIAERADIDALRPAMDGVDARVAGLLGDLLGLDHPHDLGRARIGLGVDDVQARGAQARHHQIAALDMGMGRVRAQAGAAGVPAEMMQLVAGVRHVDLADDLAVAARAGRHIDHRDRIRLLAVRVEGRDVGQRLRRGLHGHAGRRVEGGIGLPGCHDDSLRRRILPPSIEQSPGLRSHLLGKFAARSVAWRLTDHAALPPSNKGGNGADQGPVGRLECRSMLT